MPQASGFRRKRDIVYGAALKKVFLVERRTVEEDRELRRRRLDDGTYPLPDQVDPVGR